eukprot:Sspe_Gene.3057::Locus_1011_Transcript_67_72_Confidence_0.006_Length_635::g.3057::m.3057
MLDQGEDPETILAWLEAEGTEEQAGDGRMERRRAERRMIKTGAGGTRSRTTRRIEAQNEKLAEEARQMWKRSGHSCVSRRRRSERSSGSRTSGRPSRRCAHVEGKKGARLPTQLLLEVQNQG